MNRLVVLFAVLIFIGCSTTQSYDTTQQNTDEKPLEQKVFKPAQSSAPSDIQRREKVADALSDMDSQLQEALKSEISDEHLQETVQRIIIQFYDDKHKEDEIFRLIEEEIARRYGKATAKALPLRGDLDKEKIELIGKIFADLKQKEELTAQKAREGIKREEELARAKELAREVTPLSGTKDREHKVAELEKARKLIEQELSKELGREAQLKESGEPENESAKLKKELAELDKKILAEKSLLEAEQLREQIVKGGTGKEGLGGVEKGGRGEDRVAESEKEKKIAELEKAREVLEKELAQEAEKLLAGGGNKGKYADIKGELDKVNRELAREKALLEADRIVRGGNGKGGSSGSGVNKIGGQEDIAKSGKEIDRSGKATPSEGADKEERTADKSASELERERRVAELEKNKAGIERLLAEEARRSKESGGGLSNEYKRLEKELADVEKELGQEHKIAELEKKKAEIERRLLAEAKRSKGAGEGISDEYKRLERELVDLEKEIAGEKSLLADLHSKKEGVIAGGDTSKGGGDVAKTSKEVDKKEPSTEGNKKSEEIFDRLKKMEEEVARKEDASRKKAERQKWLDDIKRARSLADSRGQGGSDEEEEGVGGEKGPLAGKTPSGIEKSAAQIEREHKIAELEKIKAEIEQRLANEAKRSQDRGEGPTDEYKKLEKELSEVKRELEREHKIAELEKTKDGLERRLTEEAKKLSGGKEGQDSDKIKEELADVNKKLAIEKMLLEAEQRQKGIVKGGDAGGGSSGGQTPDVQKDKEGITPPDEVGKSGQDKGIDDNSKEGIKPEDNNIAKGGDIPNKEGVGGAGRDKEVGGDVIKKEGGVDGAGKEGVAEGGDRPMPGDIAKPVEGAEKPNEGDGVNKEGGEKSGSDKEGGELVAKDKEGKQTPAEVDKGRDAGSVDKKDVSEQEREQRVAELEKAKAVLERQLVEEIKKAQELGQGAPADGVEALKSELSKVEKMLEEEREQLLALRRERGDASGGQDKGAGEGGGEVGKGVGAEGRDGGKVGVGQGGDGLGGGPLPGDEEFLLFEEKWADVIKRVRSTLRKYYEETGK